MKKNLLQTIEKKVLAEKKLTPAEEKELALLRPTWKNLNRLFKIATSLREKYHKNLVYPCSIINARSGFCPEDCAFCAQSSKHNTKIIRYPLVSPQKIVDAVREAAKNGANCFGIVTSGRKLSNREIEIIAQAIRQIRQQKIPIHLSASLGEISLSNLGKLKSAGLERYHHNLETAPDFFPKICTTHKFSDRLRTIKNAKKAGFSVCSGGIFGLGENDLQRLKLLKILQKLNIGSVPLNFLNPIKGTRLENQEKLSPEVALKWIAIARIILPGAIIRVCGGREVVLGKYQNKIFAAGANGLMIGGYLTTSGRPLSQDLKMLKKQKLEIARCQLS